MHAPVTLFPPPAYNTATMVRSDSSCSYFLLAFNGARALLQDTQTTLLAQDVASTSHIRTTGMNRGRAKPLEVTFTHGGSVSAPQHAAVSTSALESHQRWQEQQQYRRQQVTRSSLSQFPQVQAIIDYFDGGIFVLQGTNMPQLGAFPVASACCTFQLHRVGNSTSD